jgi:peptidoglycan hydrolase CwlO-like protein
LERIALGWAQLGQVLIKTVALEAAATKLETTQNELDTRIKRARALLEETLARRARAQETLKKLEQPAPAAAATAPAAPAATPATPAKKASP